MPRSLTFATIADYKAAKATSEAGNTIYAELVSSGIKSGTYVIAIEGSYNGDVIPKRIFSILNPNI